MLVMQALWGFLSLLPSCKRHNRLMQIKRQTQLGQPHENGPRRCRTLNNAALFRASLLAYVHSFTLYCLYVCLSSFEFISAIDCVKSIVVHRQASAAGILLFFLLAFAFLAFATFSFACSMHHSSCTHIIGALKVLAFGCCDKSAREKDWRFRQRGTQATCARHGDLAGVTRARSFSACSHTHTLL